MYDLAQELTAHIDALGQVIQNLPDLGENASTAVNLEFQVEHARSMLEFVTATGTITPAMDVVGEVGPEISDEHEVTGV